MARVGLARVLHPFSHRNHNMPNSVTGCSNMPAGCRNRAAGCITRGWAGGGRRSGFRERTMVGRSMSEQLNRERECVHSPITFSPRGSNGLGSPSPTAL
jgi:hypothetical protein